MAQGAKITPAPAAHLLEHVRQPLAEGGLGEHVLIAERGEDPLGEQHIRLQRRQPARELATLSLHEPFRRLL